ncbi:MAG: 16S rRNA pseudouridine516 synthase, partial [Colwellia sp.]
MAINTSRLDRLISELCQINKKKVRLMLAQQRITVDGVLALDIDLIVDQFSRVVVDDEVLQENQPYYIMLNKPIGVV